MGRRFITIIFLITGAQTLAAPDDATDFDSLATRDDATSALASVSLVAVGLVILAVTVLYLQRCTTLEDCRSQPLED